MYFAKYADRKNYVSLKEDGVIPFDEEKHIVHVERGVTVTAETSEASVDIIEMPVDNDPFKD